MKFNDKREDLLKDIILDKSRVNYSQPIVFMCGGRVDVTEAETLSVREALVEYLHAVGCELSASLALAENYKDWLHDSTYNNLIDFETDIAQISSLIVLCLESAGSITELGLFVKNPALRKKLLVFVSDDHCQENSFIRLGPLRYLQAKNEASVCAYPWDYNNLKASLSASFEEMRGDIQAAVTSKDNSEQFDSENYGHVAFVIFEIVKVYKALKLTEITQYLSVVGIDVKLDQLRRLLFLLEKLNLIGGRRRGHTMYYYAVSAHKKISFGGKFDQVNAALEAQKFYVTNDSEKSRLEVITANLPTAAVPREAAPA